MSKKRQEMGGLEFRKLEETDLEALRRWRMLPEVTKYLFTDPVLTVDDQRRWFKEFQEKDNSIYWILNFEEIDIGYAALKNIDRKNKRACPGVYIGEVQYQGRGLGKSAIAILEEYAFEHLHLHKLYEQILSENYASLITYLKCGWKIEGILRNHVFKDKFYDVYLMELLKEDWIKWI